MRKLGPDEPAKYNYHFKHMTTVGEPIEPEVWRWYYQAVGKGEAVIVDTWWQTETGRVPRRHAARPAANEARQLRSRRAGHLPGDLRRVRQGARGRRTPRPRA